ARHAGIGIAGEDRHRPLVVAWPLLRVPGRGIARTVVDQVELRVVRVPAPGRAAADLPLIAFPGLEARISADRFAEFGGLLRIDQQVLVGALGPGAPDLLAVGGRVGGDPAAHAELAAGDADIHLV